PGWIARRPTRRSGRADRIASSSLPRQAIVSPPVMRDCLHMLTYRILGPVEARDGDAPLRVGGPRERRLLAVLLVNRNLIVPVHRLVAVLWDAEPPPTARAQIHNSISALRRNLVTRDGQRAEIVRSESGFS